jgi:hypothetical protein
MEMTKLEKIRAKPHYVNNKEFSQAVVEYVKSVNEAVAADKPKPIVPDYIAKCFLRICNGLSYKSNLSTYTYREEMVMDAVENCLKAVDNYNIDTVTRTGQPNAFSYFTQISYFAFLRRIAKEKKQHDLKYKFIENCGIEAFMDVELSDLDNLSSNENQYLEEIKSRLNNIQQNFKPS